MNTSVTAALVGLFLESLLCGSYVTVYVSHTWELLSAKWAHGRSMRDKALIVGSLLMFVVTVGHLATDIYIAVSSGVLQGASLDILSHNFGKLNGLNALSTVKVVIYVIQTSIWDVFMIYRAFVVWNKSWRVVALPLSLVITEIALGVTTIILARTRGTLVKAHTFLHAYFVTTVATNFICTLLILKPILLSRSTAREYRPEGSRFRTVRWRVAESILQSAAIFTISSISFTVTSFVSPIGSSICHYIFPSIVSMAFSLAVKRVCLSTAVSGPPHHPVFEVDVHGQGIASYPSLPMSLENSEVSAQAITIEVSVSTTHASDNGSIVSFEKDPESALQVMGNESIVKE